MSIPLGESSPDANSNDEFRAIMAVSGYEVTENTVDIPDGSEHQQGSKPFDEALKQLQEATADLIADPTDATSQAAIYGATKNVVGEFSLELDSLGTDCSNGNFDSVMSSLPARVAQLVTKEADNRQRAFAPLLTLREGSSHAHEQTPEETSIMIEGFYSFCEDDIDVIHANAELIKAIEAVLFNDLEYALSHLPRQSVNSSLNFAPIPTGEEARGFRGRIGLIEADSAAWIVFRPFYENQEKFLAMTAKLLTARISDDHLTDLSAAANKMLRSLTQCVRVVQENDTIAEKGLYVDSTVQLIVDDWAKRSKVLSELTGLINTPQEYAAVCDEVYHIVKSLHETSKPLPEARLELQERVDMMIKADIESALECLRQKDTNYHEGAPLEEGEFLSSIDVPPSPELTEITDNLNKQQNAYINALTDAFEHPDTRQQLEGFSNITDTLCASFLDYIDHINAVFTGDSDTCIAAISDQLMDGQVDRMKVYKKIAPENSNYREYRFEADELQETLKRIYARYDLANITDPGNADNVARLRHQLVTALSDNLGFSFVSVTQKVYHPEPRTES